MYGLVNKAIREYAIEHFGNEVWDHIYNELNLSESHFISIEPQPDAVTFGILEQIILKTKSQPDDFTTKLGEYFFDFAAKEGFDHMLEMGGDTLPELLHNLNDLHFRIQMLMPNLNPPRFEVSDETDQSLKLHYYSTREGLNFFLLGVLNALVKKFELNATMAILPPVSEGEKCIIAISWEEN